MGSATTHALATSTQALAVAKGPSLDAAGELFVAAGLIGQSTQLSGALADHSAPAGTKEKAVDTIFSGATPFTRELLRTVVAQRWSDAADLVDGIEELGVRTVALASPDTDIEGELFSFLRVVADNPELELALGSRLGSADARAALVSTLLGGTADVATTLIATSLVRDPRGRRIRQLLTRAMTIVSEQRGRIVATVHTAKPLSDHQRTRLADTLSRRYGGNVSINEVIDPQVVGGLRVQIADDVIDGSISARLADLRQRLAG